MITKAKGKSFNPTANKGRTFPPEPLSPDEVLALLGGFSRRGSAGIRDKSMACLLWRTGLRISEALGLYPRDVDFAKCTVRVARGKGGKFRIVGVDHGCLAQLQVWFDRRKALGLNGRHRLFCTLGGKPQSDVAYRAALGRAGKRAGIEKRVHPHGLRHTHASELRQEGVDVGVISKQLGHSNIATTARYLDHVNPQAVVDTISARKW